METSLRRVDMVCTVSEFTRQEFLSFFSFPSDRIKVIHNGFTSTQSDNGHYEKKANEYLKINNLPQSYLFHIGASDPRKNLDRLIEAMFQCREQYKDIPHLLVAGINTQDWATSDTKIRIEELGLSSHIHLCGVLKKDLLIGLTKKAYTLCYPSLYEGFGFPPLEAMSLGVPVLAGRNSSIPEIVGDSACLVDPESVADIARGLIKVVYDQDYRNNLIDSGYRQITKFSWEKTAMDYLDAYREVSAS
jgi:glycosyltransferase involved in cell wall biosynthesis